MYVRGSSDFFCHVQLKTGQVDFALSRLNSKNHTPFQIKQVKSITIFLSKTVQLTHSLWGVIPLLLNHSHYCYNNKIRFIANIKITDLAVECCNPNVHVLSYCSLPIQLGLIRNAEIHISIIKMGGASQTRTARNMRPIKLRVRFLLKCFNSPESIYSYRDN